MDMSASATETVDYVSILGQVKPSSKELITALLPHLCIQINWLQVYFNSQM